MELIERLSLVSIANDIVLARLYITCYNGYMHCINFRPYTIPAVFDLLLSDISLQLEDMIVSFEWYHFP